MQLSATDPASTGGGGAPKTVEANAFADHWEPNALTATVGDTVKWNFPAATAGTVHDLWIIKPGESPTSDGTRLSNNDSGNIVLPGGPSITQVVDTAGTYTFLCKIHSHKGRDELAGHGRDGHRCPGRRLDPGFGGGLHRVPGQHRRGDGRVGPPRQHRDRRVRS